MLAPQGDLRKNIISKDPASVFSSSGCSSCRNCNKGTEAQPGVQEWNFTLAKKAKDSRELLASMEATSLMRFFQKKVLYRQ